MFQPEAPWACAAQPTRSLLCNATNYRRRVRLSRPEWLRLTPNPIPRSGRNGQPPGPTRSYAERTVGVAGIMRVRLNTVGLSRFAADYKTIA